MNQHLNISYNGIPVGVLNYDGKNGIFGIVYDEAWKQEGFAISPHIPLNKAPEPYAIERFLKNLLPEGEGLEKLSTFMSISKGNVFGLVRSIGLDASGALVFGLPEEDPKPLFREITEEELSDRISQMATRSIVVWDGKVRLSVAGVQAKLPVMMKEGAIGLGDGAYASTHILKFEKNPDTYAVLNEFFCMRLAKAVGLDVAEVELKRFGKHTALLVTRFDRIFKDGKVIRSHVIDGCQLLDLAPSDKYEHNHGSAADVRHMRDGASFPKLFAQSNPFESKVQASMFMLRWAIFTLLISNADAHGKNISFFVDKHGISPAPLYDMLSVAMYVSIDEENNPREINQELAMAFGDEFEVESVKAYDLIDFAKESGISDKLVSVQAKRLCDSVEKLLPFDTGAALSADEKRFIDKLEKLIRSRIEAVRESALSMKNVSY